MRLSPRNVSCWWCVRALTGAWSCAAPKGPSFLALMHSTQAALLRAARPPPGGDQTPQEAMFSAADLNGDGVLSRCENVHSTAPVPSPPLLASAEFQAAAAHSPQFAAVVASHAHATAPPTRSQLVRAGLVSAVPFLGFGFCDNRRVTEQRCFHAQLTCTHLTAS